MIGLLLNLVIIVVVFGVIYYIVGLLPLPEPFGRIAQIVLGLVLLLVLLDLLLGWGGRTWSFGSLGRY